MRKKLIADFAYATVFISSVAGAVEVGFYVPTPIFQVIIVLGGMVAGDFLALGAHRIVEKQR